MRKNNLSTEHIKIALYQPDIPQNVGAMMRLCACLNVGLEVIEPCGFPWDEKKIRQSAMDYFDAANINRHSSWNAFIESHSAPARIILMTTRADMDYIDFKFQPGDILLAGRESSGVPEDIHNAADSRLAIPMQGGLRSLNIVNATSMILGEALRQTNGFR